MSLSEFGELAIEFGALRSDVASLRKRIEAIDRLAVKRDMALGMDYEQVHPEEMRRLRMIEIAARQFKAWLRPGETTALHRESSILEPLWEALER